MCSCGSYTRITRNLTRCVLLMLVQHSDLTGDFVMQPVIHCGFALGVVALRPRLIRSNIEYVILAGSSLCP